MTEAPIHADEAPSSGVVERAEALHRRVQATIDRVARGEDPFGSGERFDDLALALARFQRETVEGYRRLVRQRGIDVDRAPASAWPAVPTDAFRLARVATFPASLDAVRFLTSGTTQGARGVHAMRTLETYRRAALVWADRTIFAEFAAPPRMVVIAPPPETADESSLVAMLRWFVERDPKRATWCSPDDVSAVERALTEASQRGEPTLLLATAFAWVHLADALGERTIPMPRGSRAMQTGGFKGRSREIDPATLRRTIAERLAIEEASVVGEYGMTELSSQLWSLSHDAEGRFRYRAPPWVRVVACDPVSLAPRAVGERGIARIEDLANVESAWAIQTADEIVVEPDGAVVVLGRLPGSTPRGCSLAIEELLGR